jgi:hypothetical protein
LSSIRSPSGATAVQPGVAEVVPEPVRVGVYAGLAATAGDHLVDAGGSERLAVVNDMVRDNDRGTVVT